MNDMRALQALEKLIGRKNTVKFIEKHYGEVDFHTHAESEEKFIKFREELNKEIAINS